MTLPPPPLAPATDPFRRLEEFFAREMAIEEGLGFARAGKIPDDSVERRLAMIRGAPDNERRNLLSCCAFMAARWHAGVVGLAPPPTTSHPYYDLWAHGGGFANPHRNVRLLTAIVQQSKMDARTKRAATSYTAADVEVTTSMKSIKAPELQKRARRVCEDLGPVRKDPVGDLVVALSDERRVVVHVDTGGRTAQFRYHVVLQYAPGSIATNFERVLGIGMGDWTFIVDHNVDEAFVLFEQLLRYIMDFPARLQEWMR